MTPDSLDHRDAAALDHWWNGVSRIDQSPDSPPDVPFRPQADRLLALDRELAADRAFLHRLESRLLGAPGQHEAIAPLAASAGLPIWSAPGTAIAGRPRSGPGRISLYATAALVLLTFAVVGLIANWAAGDGNPAPEQRLAAVDSPVAGASVRIEDCTVAPPTSADIGAIRATPAAIPPMPSPTTGVFRQDQDRLPPGSAVDDGILARIETTLRLLTACRYDDKDPFGAGWTQGASAGRYYGLFSPQYFRLGQFGGYFDPSFAGRDGRVWRPQNDTPPIVASAVQLPDGRVVAIVRDEGDPGRFTGTFIATFRSIEGSWFIDSVLNVTEPANPIAGTPGPGPAATFVFRDPATSLDLNSVILYEDMPNVLTLINVGEDTRRFTIPALAIDVTIDPLSQADIVIEGETGQYDVVTFSGDEQDPPLTVTCMGTPVNGGTLRIYPAGAIAVNPCAKG